MVMKEIKKIDFIILDFISYKFNIKFNLLKKYKLKNNKIIIKSKFDFNIKFSLQIINNTIILYF